MGKAAKTVGNVLTGTGKDPGILGVGQYKGSSYDPNADAFDNAQTADAERMFAKQAQDAQGRAAPTAKAASLGNANLASAAAINQTPQAQFRNQQQTLAGQLSAQAAGQGPSLAMNQLRQGTDRNIQQAMAMAASQRGANPALALRQLGGQVVMANQQAASDAANLRAQEQMAAREQLGGVLSGARTQDIGLATDQAGLTQQAALANQGAKNEFAAQQAQMQQQAALANQQAALQSRQLNDQASQFYNNGVMQSSQANRDAQIALENLRVQNALGVNSANAGAYASAGQNRAGVLGGMGQGIATYAALSDENMKTDIKDGESAAKTTLDKVKDTVAKLAGAGKMESGFRGEGQGIGMGLGAALGLKKLAPAVAASDEELKENIQGGDGSLKGFLNAIKAKQYEYKDPKFGEGTHVSPMAQDLEKTPLGDSLVIDTPQGKMVDYAKAGGLMLASAAMLNDRMGDLENKVKKAFAARKKANG